MADNAAIGSGIGTLIGGPDIGGSIGGVIGGMFGPSAMSDRKAAALQYEYAQKIAQNSIQWRVEDAKKAGIHPLFALGANVHVPSPSVIGGGDGGLRHAPSFSNMGQDLSRSMAAALSSEDRVASKLATQLALEKAGLENDLLRSQIARENSGTVGPGNPNQNLLIPGQGNSSVRPLAATPIIGDPHKYGKEAGVITDFGYSRTASGGLAPIPSKDMTERLEMEAGVFPSVPSIAWMYRNNISPNFPWNWVNHSTKPPISALPKGAGGWRWSVREQAWMPVKF